MAIGLITYDDNSRREDLADFITNISVKETPFLSGLQQTTAQGTLHEYLLDTYGASADNAQVEAMSYAAVDLTQPSRLTNVCQILKKAATVSGTEQAVNAAGQSDPMRYQIAKKMVELAKDTELALVGGSRASGSSGVARRMCGVINSISTNATARNSGSSLGESDFNDIMQLIYASTDEVADEVYVGATLKRDISMFTAGTTKNMESTDKRLIRPIDVYESDFGVHKIFLHREVSNAANAKVLLAINSKHLAIAFLRRTKAIDIAKSGDADNKLLLHELTLENRAQASMAYVSGFTS